MRLKVLMIAMVTCLLWLATWVMTPTAFAITKISLSDLSYHDCPPELAQGAVTSWGVSTEANCFLITGKAENFSGKPVYDADVFGRIYDANGNPVLQNRTRVGSIDVVPPGTSDFEVRISVSTNQTTPLQLEQFRASGFTGNVKPQF